MTWAQVVLYAAGTATLLAAGGGLIRLARGVWHLVQRAQRLMDDLLGEPARPGVDARPGVLERLAAIEERLSAVAALELSVRSLSRRLEAVERELHPNGGASLRDAVDRLSRPPAVEAAGGLVVERADTDPGEGARIAYGFTEQRSR